MDRKYFCEGFFQESYYFKSMVNRFKIEKVLHSEDSTFQKIDVIDTKAVGKLLLLDGKTMVSDLDEFVYHEVISHVPVACHKQAKKVLIVGGGDGGAVREFAKHQHIEQIDLVEIDERVIEVSREFFPQCTSALDDPRVRILPTDGVKFVEDAQDIYDIVVIDSTDPENFAEGLFEKEFYDKVFRALKDDGIMTAQTESPFFDEFQIAKFYRNLKEVFPIVEAYSAPMSIYPGVNWTFAFASKTFKGREIHANKIADMKKLESGLKFYNTDWHAGTFALDNFTKKVLGL